MWNIRSHARRFPVHTGTLTPSIAHPNRFLNHLKRFSAGFLTFKGGKIKNTWFWEPNQRFGMRGALASVGSGGAAGRACVCGGTLSVTPYGVPAPPKGELLDIFRSARIKLPLSGELANPQGLTERVKPTAVFQSLRPCSTWNKFTVLRLRWECAPYTRYTRPSLPDGR